MNGLLTRSRLILLAMPAVAIALWPLAATQILPLPKLTGMLLLAMSYLLFCRPALLKKQWDLGTILVSSYAAMVGAMLFRVAISPLPQLELWGVASRLNGTMLYLALGVVLWAGRDEVLRNAPWMPVYGLVVAGLLTGGYAVLQYFGNDIISWTTAGYISSLGNPDHTASFHAMVVIAGLWTVTDRSRPLGWRVAAAVSGAMGLALVGYWAHHEVIQGALLLSLVLAGLVAVEVVRHGHRTALLLVSGAGALLLLPLVFSAALGDRGVLDRLYLFEGGIRMWLAHPAIGVGVGRVQDYYNQFRDLGELAQFGLTRMLDDVHSVPIQIFSMTGVLGGVPYLVFLTIATALSGKVMLSLKESPLGVDRILAAISLVWIGQSTFSPDSATLSLAGMSAFSVLAGRRLIRDAPEVLAASKIHWWRWGFVAVLLVVLAQRIWIDFQFVWIDSRFSRTPPTTSTLRAIVANDRVTHDVVAAIRRFPPDPTLHTRVASNLGMRGYDNEAVGLLLEIVIRNPNDVDATSMLARHYQTVKAIGEASRYVRRLTALVPFNPEAWVQRADLALVAKDTADARMSLDSAVVLARRIPLPDKEFWRSVRTLRGVLATGGNPPR